MPCQFDEAVLDRRRPERVAGTQERRRLERARPTIRPACVRVGRSNTLGCTTTSNIGSDLWQRHMFRSHNHTLTTYHVSLNTSILLRRIHHQIQVNHTQHVSLSHLNAARHASWQRPPLRRGEYRPFSRDVREAMDRETLAQWYPPAAEKLPPSTLPPTLYCRPSDGASAVGLLREYTESQIPERQYCWRRLPLYFPTYMIF